MMSKERSKVYSLRVNIKMI